MLHFNGSKILKIQKFQISVGLSILEKLFFSICAQGSPAIAPWPPGGPWPPVWEPLLYRMYAVLSCGFQVVSRSCVIWCSFCFQRSLLVSACVRWGVEQAILVADHHPSLTNTAMRIPTAHRHLPGLSAQPDHLVRTCVGLSGVNGHNYRSAIDSIFDKRRV